MKKFIVKRQPENTPTAITIERAEMKPDLEDWRFLKSMNTGVDEYCHVSEYHIYQKAYKKQ